jgi:predicted dehydrogenase
MAATQGECARMNAVAAEKKRVLAIGMVRRFFPAYAQLRQILRDGQLGTVESFEYREGDKFGWGVTTPAAFRRRREGGTGVLFDIGPHVIDYLTWTLEELEAVSYADDAIAGIESNMSMEVEARNCSGSIHLSWDHPQANELRVMCANGEAVLRVDRFDQLAVNRSVAFRPERINVSFPADARPTAGQRLTPESYGGAIYCQIVQVIRAIDLGEAPAVDGDAGRRCISTLESALSMAGPVDAPWLDVTQRAAFERLHWSRTA